MTAQWKSPYRINLVRNLREQEKLAERRRSRAMAMGFACFGVLAASLAYCAFSVWRMEGVIASENRKLEALNQEYRKYTATNMTVDKGDVELLNSLQGRGIFWTKKLGAMATHLPDNYWITKFSFNQGTLKVSGFGYPSPRQDQLLILDEYLNRLRKDTTFSSIFTSIFLNSAARGEEGQGNVAFEYTATARPAVPLPAGAPQ